MMKKMVCLFLSLMISFSFFGDNSVLSKNSENTKQLYQPIHFENRDTYISVCHNENLELFYRSDIGAYRLLDFKSKEILWDTVVSEEWFNLGEYEGKWLYYMQSVLVVNYAIKKDTTGMFMKAYSGAPTSKIETYSLQNGLRQIINFNKLNISVTLDTVINDDGISVTVPDDGVCENGDYVAVSLEIMPFLSASTTKNDGYLVYPDGNGALTYFNSSNKKNVNSSALLLDIYGTINLEEIDSKDNNSTAALPFFGIKRDNIGLAAAIISGDSDAQISVNPNLDISPVDLYYQHFIFRCRQTYKVYLSGIGSNISEISSGTKIGDIINAKRCIRYFLLRGQNANYSGMANVYRDYLKKSKKISQNITDVPKVYLELFMGAVNQNSLFGSMVTLTEFEDIIKIIKEYKNQGIENIEIMLRGWNKGGYGNKSLSYKPSSSFGGKCGLEKLVNYVNSCDGVSLMLELGVVDIQSEKATFGLKQSGVLLGNNTVLTDSKKEKYYIAPQKALTVYKKAKKWLSRYDNVSIAVRDIGSKIYTDYRRNKKMYRDDTMLNFTKMSNGAVQGVNAYVLAKADYLYDIPFFEKADRIADRQIPLISMIISGCISSSAKTGNSSSDYELLKLRWIEYGLTPCFELTMDSPIDLINTNYKELFSSENSRWGETVVKTYKEWKENIFEIYGKEMLSHELLDEDVVCINYENGMSVIINYSNSEFTFDTITIPKRDYKVMKGGMV